MDVSRAQVQCTYLRLECQDSVKQTALMASTSTLPAVEPLPKPQPSRKKRTFAQLLTSGRHAGKEISSAVANSAPPISLNSEPMSS